MWSDPEHTKKLINKLADGQNTSSKPIYVPKKDIVVQNNDHVMDLRGCYLSLDDICKIPDRITDLYIDRLGIKTDQKVDLPPNIKKFGITIYYVNYFNMHDLQELHLYGSMNTYHIYDKHNKYYVPSPSKHNLSDQIILNKILILNCNISINDFHCLKLGEITTIHCSYKVLDRLPLSIENIYTIYTESYNIPNMSAYMHLKNIYFENKHVDNDVITKMKLSYGCNVVFDVKFK